MNKDPSKFWNYLSSKTEHQSIPENISFNEKNYNGEKEVVDAFTLFFESVFTKSSATVNNKHNG